MGPAIALQTQTSRTFALEVNLKLLCVVVCVCCVCVETMSKSRAERLAAARVEVERLFAQTPAEIKAEAKAAVKAKAKAVKAAQEAQKARDRRYEADRNAVADLWNTTVDPFNPTADDGGSKTAVTKYHTFLDPNGRLLGYERIKSDKAMANEVFQTLRPLFPNVYFDHHSDEIIGMIDINRIHITAENYSFYVSHEVYDKRVISRQYIGRVFNVSNLRDAVCNWIRTITPVVV